jgi:hypothetical protein
MKKWKEIEVSSVDELDPHKRYRVRVGENWLPVDSHEYGVIRQWHASNDSMESSVGLGDLLVLGCPIEVEVDDGPRRWEAFVACAGILAIPGEFWMRNAVVIEKREGERVVVVRDNYEECPVCGSFKCQD